MIDEHSHTWAAVKRRAEEIEEEATAIAQTRGLEPIPTEFERGRLAAVRAILALAAEEPSEMPSEDVTY